MHAALLYHLWEIVTGKGADYYCFREGWAGPEGGCLVAALSGRSFVGARSLVGVTFKTMIQEIVDSGCHVFAPVGNDEKLTA